MAPPDMIDEPATETSAAVIEFEPYIPHNNTTGEMKVKCWKSNRKMDLWAVKTFCDPATRLSTTILTLSTSCKIPTKITCIVRRKSIVKTEKTRRWTIQISLRRKIAFGYFKSCSQGTWNSITSTEIAIYNLKFLDNYENGCHLMNSHHWAHQVSSGEAPQLQGTQALSGCGSPFRHWC